MRIFHRIGSVNGKQGYAEALESPARIKSASARDGADGLT